MTPKVGDKVVHSFDTFLRGVIIEKEYGTITKIKGSLARVRWDRGWYGEHALRYLIILQDPNDLLKELL